MAAGEELVGKVGRKKSSTARRSNDDPEGFGRRRK